jgi:hypothetical protein
MNLIATYKITWLVLLLLLFIWNLQKVDRKLNQFDCCLYLVSQSFSCHLVGLLGDLRIVSVQLSLWRPSRSVVSWMDIKSKKHLLALPCLSVSLCLSVCMYHYGSHWLDFHWNWIFETFVKICWETPNMVKLDNSAGYLTRLYGWKQYNIFCCSVVVEGEPILHFHGKARWFYFVDSCM